MDQAIVWELTVEAEGEMGTGGERGKFVTTVIE